MSGIALLLSKEEMVACCNQLDKSQEYDLNEIKCIDNTDVVNEARTAVSNGATVIVARGMQALNIKKYTNVPVVEIRLTSQEIGLLIKEGKKLTQKKKPLIAIIGFKNMFCDMSYIEDIFDIYLKTYLVNEFDELQKAINYAIEEKVDIIIGEDAVTQGSKIAGIPSLLLSITDDSIKEAFKIANNLCYAIETEKRNSAQINVMLDYSFNGIIKVNQSGNISVINHIMEEILDENSENVINKPITSLITELDIEQIKKVLNTGEEIYSTFIRVNKIPLIVIVAAIKVGKDIEGAILSFQKIVKSENSDAKLLKETYLNGYVAKTKFENMPNTSKKIRDIINMAKVYSLSKSPILIYGETGTEKEMLAESIHNNSMRKNGPFVSIHCSGLTEAEQIQEIFGSNDSQGENHCIMQVANHGTLFINGINKMTLRCQQKIYSFIVNNEYSPNNFSRKSCYDVRIIASCEKNLLPLMQKGIFRPDLYYVLTSLSLEIPPIRERKDGIVCLIDNFVKLYSEAYSRYHVLTEGAYNVLVKYYWAGNLVQLKSFVERMVLTAKHRSIDEVSVKMLLEELYPIIHKENNIERMIIYKNPEAIKISELLKKYNGNRTLVADELRVSKTTLWRYMKKFGIS